MKINILQATLDYSLGLDNEGLSLSYKDGEITNSFAIKTDRSQLKMGFETSETRKNTNSIGETVNNTTYTNVSIDAWVVVVAIAVAVSINTGIPVYQLPLLNTGLT